MIIVIAKKKNNVIQSSIELLSKIKDNLKTSDIAKSICLEYGFDESIIDGIPISFSDDLDVSAKTINSKIELNSSLLNDSFEVVMRYAIHELVHALQHMKREGKGDPYKNKEYLDRPDELEAFQYQVEFENQAIGPDEAKEYVDELVDYHDIPDSEKETKKKELMERVDS